MVKKLLLFIVALCSIAFLQNSFAAEFSSSVDRSKIALNDQVTLRLKLSDASAKSQPDFSKILTEFDIISQAQSNSYQMINGSTSSSTEWILGLKPKKIGTTTIPKIDIETSAGTLFTETLTIEVKKSRAPTHTNNNKKLFIERSVSKSKLYKYETFLYTIKLYSNKELQNVYCSPFALDEATVKFEGYKNYPGKYNGEDLSVLEFNYVIIPIKDGVIKIPEVNVTGITVDVKGDGFVSIFNSILNNNQVNYVNYTEQFSLMAKPINITVYPPALNISPWLPAKNISIKDEIDNKEYFVGNSITRIISISADGLLGKQLPETLFSSKTYDDYKIYKEEPKINEQINNGKISGSRKEYYTIIPQEAGEIILPPIEIKWWNTEKSKLEISKIPQKTLNILPNRDSFSINNKQENQINDRNIEIISAETSSPKNYNFFYIVIIIFILILIAMIYQMRNSYMRLNSGSVAKSTNNVITKNPNKLIAAKQVFSKKLETRRKERKKPVTIKDLSIVKSAEELYQFLKKYSNYNLNTPINSSIEIILSNLSKNSTLTKNHYGDFTTKLEGALYANKEVDIELLKNECKSLLEMSKKKSADPAQKKAKQKLPSLNPK